MVSNHFRSLSWRRSALVAAQFALISSLAPGLRLAAQVGTVPDAPTVPIAPALPDAAIVAQPLTPASGQEIIEERPSPQHVWIGGHWRWQDGRYAWIAGRWDLPPRAGLVWVDPRWEKRGTGFALAGGYWQDGAPGATAVASAPAMPTPMVVAPPPAVVYAPPPASVGAPSAPPTVVVVEQAPPPPVREYIVERPSPRYVWIEGYWGWREGRHSWVAGHWELPPRERVEWVGPRWEHRGNGYVFVEGFWREAGVSVGVSIGGPGPMIMVREGPPPPRRERIDERHRPSRDAVWITGFWRYDGRAYVWMPGRWELPPRGNHEWIEPRWENRGGGYVFIEGHWR